MLGRQAMLITAYCDIPFLKQLLELYSECFMCYVHIDKKQSCPKKSGGCVRFIK